MSKLDPTPMPMGPRPASVSDQKPSEILRPLRDAYETRIDNGCDSEREYRRVKDAEGNILDTHHARLTALESLVSPEMVEFLRCVAKERLGHMTESAYDPSRAYLASLDKQAKAREGKTCVTCGAQMIGRPPYCPNFPHVAVPAPVREAGAIAAQPEPAKGEVGGCHHSEQAEEWAEMAIAPFVNLSDEKQCHGLLASVATHIESYADARLAELAADRDKWKAEAERLQRAIGTLKDSEQDWRERYKKADAELSSERAGRRMLNDENRVAMETLANVTRQLPVTYYADRDISTRVGFLVDHWQRLVKLANTEHEAELSALREKAAPEGYMKLGGQWWKKINQGNGIAGRIDAFPVVPCDPPTGAAS